MLSHQTSAQGGDDDDAAEGEDAVVVGGKYKCCELGCKHYVYGFETGEALRRHMGLHEEAEEAKVVKRRTSGGGVFDDGGAAGVQSREGSSEGERGVNGRKSSMVGNGNGNGNGVGNGGGERVPASPFSGKRTTGLLPTPEAEGRRRGGGRLSLPGGVGAGGGGVRTAGPCLRCKVLKKKVCFVFYTDLVGRGVVGLLWMVDGSADMCSATARTRVKSVRSRM